MSEPQWGPGGSGAGRSPFRHLRLALALIVAGLVRLPPCPPAPLYAQVTPDLEESRRRLEEIKKEREQLQNDHERLQSEVHDLNQELDNIERQRLATNRLVNELDTQIGGLNSQVDRVTAGLLLAQDNLAEKRAVLGRRLSDIYKRGSLWSFEVLVSAESFGDLLSRSKYLYLSSRQDRSLLDEVEKLRTTVQSQRDELLGVRTQLGQRREEREDELKKYGELAGERARRLRDSRRSAKDTEARLTQLDRDEAKLNDVIAAAERARVARARPGAVAAPGAITTADIGKLDWPVDGRIVISFGRQTLPNGAVVRRNGIGISAAEGTPIKAVESGRVLLSGAMSTYGLSVIIDHGNGYYSIYSQMQEAAVRKGDAVNRGDVIGKVGGKNSDEGPHLYFEIRGSNQIALDPAEWLKKRR
ncbi:MAG: peptidoglycan DD-metalloendopeptidase family protein [Gemmatimonadota bacterium]